MIIFSAKAKAEGLSAVMNENFEFKVVQVRDDLVEIIKSKNKDELKRFIFKNDRKLIKENKMKKKVCAKNPDFHDVLNFPFRGI